MIFKNLKQLETCRLKAVQGNSCLLNANQPFPFALDWSFPFALDWSKARGPMPQAEAKARGPMPQAEAGAKVKGKN